MEKTLTLQEASRRTGIDRTTLYRWVVSGKLPAKKEKKGIREVYLVEQAQVEALLGQRQKKDYESLYRQWVEEQRNGFHTGKPLKAGIGSNEYGMRKFWEYLGCSPRVDAVTPTNLRRALSNVPVDYATQNCHFTQREQIYKGVRSFYKLLIREGPGDENTFVQMSELKPKRLFPAKKTVLQKDQLERLLDFNDEWLYARTEFDRILMRTLIMVLAYSGLRREEVVRLQIDHLDFGNDIIHVIDGKGHKNRRIGIVPKLKEQLQVWLGKYRPHTGVPNVLVTQEGRPLTGNAIAHRICRISKASGIEITAHGLRRTFATVMEEAGMPWSHMKTTLGHSSIATTEGYVMSDESRAIDWLKGFQRINSDKDTKFSISRRDMKKEMLSILFDDDLGEI